MNWMENTFLAEEREAAGLAAAANAAGNRKSHRRPMWDENGDWLETEPESAKALNRFVFVCQVIVVLCSCLIHYI